MDDSENILQMTAYLGVDCVRIGFKRGRNTTGLHPPPVDRVEPRMDLDLHDPLATSTASEPVTWRLLKQTLTQRPEVMLTLLSELF